MGCGFDEVGWTAHLPKDLLVDRGDTVTVAGVLEVIPHPPLLVNGERVPAWTERAIMERVGMPAS